LRQFHKVANRAMNVEPYRLIAKAYANLHNLDAGKDDDHYAKLRKIICPELHSSIDGNPG
jgi:hypothetical protein